MLRNISLTVLFFAAFVALVLNASSASAQITAQAGGGLALFQPAGDYSGTPAEYYDGKKYGLSSGFDLHARARAGLLGFIVAGELAYTSVSNSGDATGGGTVEVSHSIVTLSVGPEFHFGLPALPITPYVGASVQLNRFSGETTFRGISSVSSGTVPLESAMRIGLSVNGGAILSMGPGMKLDIGVSYAMMNMGGATWTDPAPSKDDREDSYGGLNDVKDPFLSVGGNPHFIASDRSINAMRFTATIMFGI